MNYREVEIFAPKDIGASGTEVIDINVKDTLSSIEVIFQTTVVTAAVMTAPHVDCITKIELVDGSDVLFAMSGKDAQALAFYHTGKMPLNSVSVKATEFMKTVIPIYFGRRLFDKMLALDPNRFSNLQLKITWNEDAANASVVANQLTVRGWAFDKKPITPQGFLMSREIKAFTPVASSYEYTDLPVDHPYRLLMLESYSTDKNPAEVLAQVKLSEDHDKSIPFDLTGEEIAQKIIAQYGMIEEAIQGADAVTAHVLYASPTYGAVALKDVDADVIAVDDDFSQITIAGNKFSTSLAVNCVYYAFLVKGYAPHHCLAIPFGDIMDMEDLYEVADIGHLRLTTQGAAAVGTSPSAKVCTQQLRSY